MFLGKKNRQTEEKRADISKYHETPSTKKIALGKISIIFTAIFWVLYIFSIIIRELIDGPNSYSFTMEAFGYATVVTFLSFSSLMYLVARQGALERFEKHKRVPRALLDKFFSKSRQAITVLVPSYAEENEVIRKTLLSAALQEYPDIRVVLLLDDKPNPTDKSDIERLERARKFDKEISEFLSVPAKRFSNAFNNFKNYRQKKVSTKETKRLINHYQWAADWLEKVAKNEQNANHVDQFFIDNVYHDLAEDFKLVARALQSSIDENVLLSKSKVMHLYQRLTWTFNAKIEVFERKKYASLSHEANKAMNLNSYIGLMGGRYIEQKTEEGIILLPTERKTKNTIDIPDSEYLLTLDADSILLREYCLRLVYLLNQPGNEDIAVTQTPYSAFPNSTSRIERLAGATTDLQHILHQGMTHHNATFWVGANAVIRKSALEDIVESEWIGGFEIKRYIQDRTVIEDTESTIDLANHGWRLENYPERLSYSATPPDFGSLVVQRRRWANGGLIILPKFLAQLGERKKNGEKVSKTEIMLRLNYLASIAWATFGLIFLLAYPYDGRLLSPLVLLAALPYFLTMASDLKYSGYRYSDIFRIYGFNLIMLPVNLAGVIKSLEQSITNKKIPFARTPKVKDRTAASIQYVVLPVLIVAFSVFTAYRNVLLGNWGNAIFAAFNAIAATWAIVAYIGMKELAIDTWLGIVNWLYVDVKSENKTTKYKNPNFNWKLVLYAGEEKGSIPHTLIEEYK